MNVIYIAREKGPLVESKWCWHEGQSRDLNLGTVCKGGEIEELV